MSFPLGLILLVGGLAVATGASAQKADSLGTLINEIRRLRAQSKFTEATPVAERLLAVAENLSGPNGSKVSTAASILARLYYRQGRLTEAERLYKRVLKIQIKVLGRDHLKVADGLIRLGIVQNAQGRYKEAEPLFERALAIRETALPSGHINVSDALWRLGHVYYGQGRYTEAEPLFKRALEIRERELSPNHLELADTIGRLAVLYDAQGRYAEAEPLFKRELDALKKTLGPKHPKVGGALARLGWLYQTLGRSAEAELAARRGVAIVENSNTDRANIAFARLSLAMVYAQQQNYQLAERFARGALKLYEKTRDIVAIGQTLHLLALISLKQNEIIRAQELYENALLKFEKLLSPKHYYVAITLGHLSALKYEQRDWRSAMVLAERGNRILMERVRSDHDHVGRSLVGKTLSEGVRSKYFFSIMISAKHHLTEQEPASGPVSTRETFEAAQWALSSEAAHALAQMAARGAMGNPKLAAIARERQDLIAEWQRLDTIRMASISTPPKMRNRRVEAANTDRLVKIEQYIAEANHLLASKFPDYAAVAMPSTLSIAEVQATLRENEALVLFFDTAELESLAADDTFVWVVTKHDARWTRSDQGGKALKREVAALRCGLDYTNWRGESALDCAKRLGIPVVDAPQARGDRLPFDHTRAYRLYKTLFGEVESFIAGKHLLIVPSGALTQLPFQVLVTKDPPPKTDDANAAWLVRNNAITVLPAVSSLAALRRVSRASSAGEPVIGIGNPLLDGDGRGGDITRAKLARQRQTCRALAAGEDAQHRVVSGNAGATPLATRGGVADLASLRRLVPLPETAWEICAVARDLGADIHDSSTILLADRATEAAVKRLSADGVLGRYRVVHFATHGLVAGQLGNGSEPGLVLTPPTVAGTKEDGYLTASEVAGLKLDADWVILSACNTAAGGTTGAEALSGLARAFFYAGARALLVSHWEVYSQAAVELITGAVRHSATIGRAEALRKAMLASIGAGGHRARPEYWAPFVVIGEGAK